MLVGLFVITFGLILLLKNLGIITESVWTIFWDIFWPAIIIAFGLNMILPKKSWENCCGMSWGKKEKEKEE